MAAPAGVERLCVTRASTTYSPGPPPTQFRTIAKPCSVATDSGWNRTPSMGHVACRIGEQVAAWLAEMTGKADRSPILGLFIRAGDVFGCDGLRDERRRYREF